MTVPADIVDSLEHAVASASPTELPALIGKFEQAKALAFARLAAPTVQQPEPEPVYLDASEIARRLNVPEHWVRERTRRGEIPHKRLGHYVKYEWAKVSATIAAMNGKGAQDAHS